MTRLAPRPLSAPRTAAAPAVSLATKVPLQLDQALLLPSQRHPDRRTLATRPPKSVRLSSSSKPKPAWPRGLLRLESRHRLRVARMLLSVLSASVRSVMTVFVTRRRKMLAARRNVKRDSRVRALLLLHLPLVRLSPHRLRRGRTSKKTIHRRMQRRRRPSTRSRNRLSGNNSRRWLMKPKTWSTFIIKFLILRLSY